jgi:hypothetical protein
VQQLPVFSPFPIVSFVLVLSYFVLLVGVFVPLQWLAVDPDLDEDVPLLVLLAFAPVFKICNNKKI